MRSEEQKFRHWLESSARSGFDTHTRSPSNAQRHLRALQSQFCAHWVNISSEDSVAFSPNQGQVFPRKRCTVRKKMRGKLWAAKETFNSSTCNFLSKQDLSLPLCVKKCSHGSSIALFLFLQSSRSQNATGKFSEFSRFFKIIGQ